MRQFWMMMNTRAILAVVATVGLAWSVSAQQAVDRNAVMEWKGKAFPKFTMKTLEDKEINNDIFKGKVTVIDFWATWCGPCKAAAPKLDAMYKENKDKGFQIIGANAGERNGKDRVYTKDNAVAYQKEHGYSYMFTYNNDALFKELKCWGYPTFFVVDGNGNVADVFVGYNEKGIKDTVATLMAAE